MPSFANNRPRFMPSRRWIFVLACCTFSIVYYFQLAVERPTLLDNSSSTIKRQKQHQDIVFLTYHDQAVDGLCLGMETAAMHGISLGALGVGMEGKFNFSKVSNKKTRKLFAFYTALTNPEVRAEYGIVHNNTIVSLCDGSDVLYVNTQEYVLERYKHLEKQTSATGGNLILVGAERNCWPYHLENAGVHCDEFPELNSTFHYLNSGTLMGRTSSLTHLLRDVLEAMQSVNEDDQQCLQKAYYRQIVQGKPSPHYHIALDTRGEVYQTAFRTNLARNEHNTKDPKGAYYNENTRHVVNTEHDVVSAMVHFNGNSKGAFVDIAKHLLKNPTSKRAAAAIRNDYMAKYPWYSDECIPKLQTYYEPG